MTHQDENLSLKSLDEAVGEILRRATEPVIEEVSLAQALHRVLAQDVSSDVDMPPFDKASMDGYACRRADAFAPMRVVERIAAGATPRHALAAGECAKVMTGAPVPPGTECILIVEEVEELGDDRVQFTGSAASSHIVPKGSDVCKGDVLLRRGRWLQPQDLAVLAAVGCARPLVAVRPRVGIVATGDELVPPEQQPGPAQIRNSNNYQLEALVTALGCTAINYGIVRDDERATRQMLETACAENDLVLSTGGVSMGDFDLVPGQLESLGFHTHLRRVAIQPGKPIVFATRPGTSFFGLSGNPVSSFLQFELLVKPFLFALQGTSPQLLQAELPLSRTLTRKTAERMAWLPATVLDGRAVPVDFHGSAHLHALSLADGLIHFPLGCLELQAGAQVTLRWCRWG